MELGPNKLPNNTLITTDNILGEGNAVLLCSTDRKDCCANSSSDIGRWYLPNGSMISDLLISNSSETFTISLGYQTVGLSFPNVTIPNSLPYGIYSCEIMNEKDIINKLYVGIYPQNKGS